MNNDIYKAIFKRKSVRKFKDEKISNEQLSQIEKLIQKTEALDDTIDLRVFLVKEGEKVHKIMNGLIGNFGKVTAPHYLVVTSENVEGNRTNAGFAVENIVLNLTSMGIASCWLGGHVKDNDVQRVLNLQKTQKPLVLIALGYAENESNAFRQHESEFKRKKLSQLAEGSFDDSRKKKLLEAARLAPSAANTQPWRFFVNKSQIDVYCDESGNFIKKKFLGKINRLDVGIALSHSKIAAENSGEKINIVDKGLIDKDQMVYIRSIVLLDE